MAKVLLIHENTGIVLFWAEYLKKKGHEVIEAFNGKEGLEILTQDTDIIFCYHNTPRMDGYEFSKSVKEDGITALIPIVGIDFPRTDMLYLDDHVSRMKPTNLEFYIKKHCSEEKLEEESPPIQLD